MLRCSGSTSSSSRLRGCCRGTQWFDAVAPCRAAVCERPRNAPCSPLPVRLPRIGPVNRPLTNSKHHPKLTVSHGRTAGQACCTLQRVGEMLTMPHTSGLLLPLVESGDGLRSSRQHRSVYRADRTDELDRHRVKEPQPTMTARKHWPQWINP